MTASLDLLLLLAAATVIAAALVGRDRPGGWVVLGFYIAQLVVLGLLDPDATSTARFHFTLLGEPLAWRFDGLSWFFAAVTLGAAVVTTWFAAGAWSVRLRQNGLSPRGLHVALALNVLAMLLLLGAADLLSLFIGWELVSWAGLLLMVLGGSDAVKAGIRYITYAIAGGMAVLAGLVLAGGWAGSLLLAPFIVQEIPIGIVTLGRAAGAPPFDGTEATLVESVVTQGEVAVQNAGLYEEIRELNRSLEVRIASRSPLKH